MDNPTGSNPDSGTGGGSGSGNNNNSHNSHDNGGEGSSSQPLLEPASGKRIVLPVRVEPKVYFANERTFLSWLNFTVVLGGLAMGLLNFGDRVARLSALFFTLIAMLSMLYALWTFQWRATKIRQRQAAPYDDRIGPTLLCAALLLAVAANFYMRM
ncbi:hypothetical protein BCR43DRAFT_525296 [Syncephalastrum racemosum]|uniref:DUF202 domain-containing protein n=1 Tax=Syncephalastrum racemosum TaxID=13706 RepID=A0A1X2HA89_SYNRA|nr:hypothetical protein BCR43DRAFT_525296 [Syncephalastrum racemosum]